MECTPRFRTFSTFPTDLWAADFSYLLKNSIKTLKKSVGMSIQKANNGHTANRRERKVNLYEHTVTGYEQSNNRNGYLNIPFTQLTFRLQAS